MAKSKEFSWPNTVIVLCMCSLIALFNSKKLYDSFAYESSPVAWCEQEYVYSKDIVEFWNTVSNIAFVIVSAFGVKFYGGERYRRIEPNIFIIWSMLALIGIGSAVFHGTLSIAGQVLDELPITLLSFFALLMMRPMNKWGETGLYYRNICFSAPFAVSLSVSASLLCILFPVLSHVITVSMIPIILITITNEYRQCSHPDKSWLFAISLSLFGFAFTIWLVDRLACETVTEISIRILGFYPQLHAWWHVFTACAFWCVVATGAVIRLSGEKRTARVTMPIPGIPVVEV